MLATRTIFLFFAICLIISANGFSQTQSSNPIYNKALADSLGADDYGMKNYVLVILKTGPQDAAITHKPTRDSLFRGHFSNMGKMAKAGKLIVAGPLGTNEKSYRGIFILNVKTVNEAMELAKTDPAVTAGIFAVECYPWYGSAALPLYLNFTDKIEKVKM